METNEWDPKVCRAVKFWFTSNPIKTFIELKGKKILPPLRESPLSISFSSISRCFSSSSSATSNHCDHQYHHLYHRFFLVISCTNVKSAIGNERRFMIISSRGSRGEAGIWTKGTWQGQRLAPGRLTIAQNTKGLLHDKKSMPYGMNWFYYFWFSYVYNIFDTIFSITNFGYIWLKAVCCRLRTQQRGKEGSTWFIHTQKPNEDRKT